MSKENIYHVISNTHWDREWRFPYQRNRQMLVEMIDNVLDILEKEPDYRAFHLDSQSVVLTDYLEIRPNKKDTIKKFVKQKRLFIGPWFILPDEFLVGGENLIRNLLLGHKICSQFGGVSKVGYSPFSWGQISQLPQLYSQFGIDLIMFYRGVNSLDSRKAEFLWEGADGTQSIASRFSTMPRYNFYFYIYRPVIHNEGFGDVEYKWTRGGVPFHFADEQMAGEDYFVIAPVDTYYKENIKEQVNKIINDQAKDFTTNNIIWMEGHDSSGPNIKTVRIIKDINKLMPDVKVVHSTLEDYSKAIYKSVDKDKLSLVKGERRSAQYDLRSGNLYGYVTSARMFLKLKNFEVEKWLQFYAESFNSVAGALGMNINDEYLNVAWNYLIQNSAHDSIGGCSLDEIHNDMMSRYKQAMEISRGVFERACKYISLNINSNKLFGKKEDVKQSIVLTAINPNFYERNEVVDAIIDIPAELDKGSFDITDEKGNKIAIQFSESAKFEPVLEQMIDRPMYFSMQRYRCHIELNNVPEFGFKAFKVTPVKKQQTKAAKNIARVSTGLPVMENDLLKVTFNKNGSINVLDKSTKKQFKQLAYFFDEGEAGHAWVHTPVAPYWDTLNEKPEIKILENGPLTARCSVKYCIKTFANYESRKAQLYSEEPLNIELICTLAKNSGRIDFNIVADNNAEDHRLRVMFPVDINATCSEAEGQFDVVQRSLERPDTTGWVEQPMYDYPLHNFVDLTDGKTGAAVFASGIKEYEIINDRHNTIALTLLRAFTYVIQPSAKEDYSHQKGSQCLGKQGYKIAFFPHEGNWQKGNVYAESLNFNNEIRLMQTGRTNGKLNPTTSFFQIQPKDLVYSCLKQPEDLKNNTFILRLYNPTDKQIKGNIKSIFNITEVKSVTLEEKDIEAIKPITKNKFRITIGKKKIATYKITLN